MNFRTELTILKLEPDGAMMVIESGASDGTIVVIRARVVEPLRVGDSLALTLVAQPAAATAGPTMRERMQARIQDAASSSGPTPRLSVTLNNLGSTGAPASTATPASAAAAGNAGAPASVSTSSAPITTAAPQTSSALGDASSMLLSSILGASPRSSVQMERNVDDEMDALFGARRKG